MTPPIFQVILDAKTVADGGASLVLDFERQEYRARPAGEVRKAIAVAEGLVPIGDNPVRFYPFDFAPQPRTKAYAVPYAVWQVVTGMPENYLDCAPDIDSYSLQVDVYGGSVTEVQAAVKGLRDALEPHGYITRWGNEEREKETGLYRYGFDFDFWVKR